MSELSAVMAIAILETPVAVYHASLLDAWGIVVGILLTLFAVAAGGRGRGEVDLHDGADRDEALAADWRELAELRGNPFLTPEWFRSCAALAGAGEDDFVLVWRRDGEVRGVLPLTRSRRRLLKVLRFAGAPFADWLTPVCRPEDERQMATDCALWLGSERKAWDLLELTRLEVEGAWPAALWEAPGGRLASARPQSRDVLPFIRFGEGGYEEYLAGLSRNRRSQLRRKRRKLESEHGLVFSMTTREEDLEEDLGTFFRLHEERWEERGGSAALSAEWKQVHSRFAAAALERGWLRLWTASLDGEPGAAWYGWRIGERYCFALSGLRNGTEPLSLGTVMLARTIEGAAGEGALVYDMLRGDEPYKRGFETGRREAESLVLGRRLHPATLASSGLERTVAAARGLPPGLREPAARAFRKMAPR
jgi:CelD/BcsL family acetyltransferase involved in cellulose biosynthesis